MQKGCLLVVSLLSYPPLSGSLKHPYSVKESVRDEEDDCLPVQMIPELSFDKIQGKDLSTSVGRPERKR